MCDAYVRYICDDIKNVITSFCWLPQIVGCWSKRNAHTNVTANGHQKCNHVFVLFFLCGPSVCVRVCVCVCGVHACSS